MSKDREIVLEVIPITPPKARGDEELREGEKDVLEVSLNYQLGGHSFFTGNFSRRGYYISATLLRIGGGFRSMLLSGDGLGLKHCIKESSRFNRNTLNKLEDEARSHEMYDRLVETVLEKAECKRIESEDG